MLVSHQKRFIYLKTLKTAGTSVEIFFEKYCCPIDAYIETHATEEIISREGIIGYRGPNPPSEYQYYNHMPAADLRSKIGAETWDSYYKFCVIRNPYDKVVSWWWFRLSENERNLLAKATFDDIKRAFKGYVLDSESSFPMDRQIYTIDGAVAVDRFIRYEKLHEDLTAVSKSLGIDFQSGELGTYKSGARMRMESFADYYDADSTKIVEARYSWEIETFGYSLTQGLMK